MFDKKITPLYQRILDPLANFLANKNVAADTITIIGFCLGLLTLPAIIYGFFFCSILLIIVNRVLDGLDGIVARKTCASNRGAFLDFTLDCIFYSMVPLGFAFNDIENNAISTLLLLASFVGTSVSFLSFSIIAEREGLYLKDHEDKGLYYSSSFMEGTETIIFFILMCLFPAYYNHLAYAFAFGCFITVILRLKSGWILF